MRAAWAFLTPLGGAVTPDARTVRWFPMVGVVLGGVVGGVWWGAVQWWPPIVAGALAMAADLVVTGMLHLDGLADSADGLLPPVPPERRLAIMSQPDVGAFGVGVAVTTLVLRTAVLATLPERWPTVLLVAGIWCLSRTAMAVLALVLPYARESGLASSFLAAGPDLMRTLSLTGGAVVGAACVVAGTWSLGGAPEAIVTVLALAAAAAAVGLLARRRLGGFTGDVLGAACLLGETAALLVAVARW